MKGLLALFLIVPSVLTAQEPGSLIWSVCAKQKALYFSSDHVTMAGVGGGVGLQMVWNEWLIARADANILWGNGNTLPVQVAVGVQRHGRWSPAVLTTFSILAGQRTEILTQTGQRPPFPVWAIGVLLIPLRFEGAWGYASTLELGAGLGPDSGLNLEVALLTVGVRW
jgi:hypothetical protein